MAKGRGTFLEVGPDWFRDLPVNESGLKAVFADLRADADSAGCRSFPGRDDVATNEVLFKDVLNRYEKITGKAVPDTKYPHFRRWVLLLFKGGDMPKS